MPASEPSVLTIGEVARSSGVPAKTIRYYEEIALLAQPQRAANGYRIYGSASVERLRFIKRSRDLGFAIADVTELLSLYDDPNRSAKDVRALATAHIATIDTKLNELTSLRRTLSTLVDSCHGTERPDCPILHDLQTHQEST